MCQQKFWAAKPSQAKPNHKIMITSEHWNNDSLGNGAQLNENTCRKLQHVNSKTFSPSVVGVVIEALPRSSLKEPYLQPRSSGAEVGSVESLLIKIVKQGGSKKIVCLTRISCSFFEAGQKKVYAPSPFPSPSPSRSSSQEKLLTPSSCSFSRYWTQQDCASARRCSRKLLYNNKVNYLKQFWHGLSSSSLGDIMFYFNLSR